MLSFSLFTGSIEQSSILASVDNFKMTVFETENLVIKFQRKELKVF